MAERWCLRAVQLELIGASLPSSPGRHGVGLLAQKNAAGLGVLTRGRSWQGITPIGLAVAPPLSSLRWPMAALTGGSSAKTRGKTESRLFVEDPCAGGGARGDGLAWRQRERRLGLWRDFFKIEDHRGFLFIGTLHQDVRSKEMNSYLTSIWFKFDFIRDNPKRRNSFGSSVRIPWRRWVWYGHDRLELSPHNTTKS
jgi:hypothetical protein